MQKLSKVKMRYDTGDSEFIANPLDFIPLDPDDNLHFNGSNEWNLENVKGALCIICQFIIIFFSVILLAVAYGFYSDVNLKRQPLQYLSQTAAPLPTEYFKLKQQCDRINEETNLLKGQLLDFVRWRKNLPKEIQAKLEAEIENALEQYDADKTGAIDFALETDGGSVTSTPSTIPFKHSVNHLIMGLVNVEVKHFSDPQLLIRPGVLPGQCFAFEGSEGRIRIRLKREIVVTSVTLEHVHKNLVSDVESAPKNIEIIGLSNEEDEDGKRLGQFVYEIEGKVLQTFELGQEISNESYQHVELHVLSNYGNKNYTCIYRIRIHGIPVD